MSHSARIARRVVALVVIPLVAVLLVPAAQARAAFQVGLQDPGFAEPASSTGAELANAALQRIGGSVIRVGVDWSQVVTDTATMPSGFDPSNPGDSHYAWAPIDAAVRRATRLHARVLLDLFRAPEWAEGPNRPPETIIARGGWDPSPEAFASFAHAAAVRYSGAYPDPLHAGARLPRVTYWEIWNEENLPIYLGAPDLVDEYRSLLDAAYGAIKAVSPANVIVIGGLAPVSYLPPLSMAPLQFAAQLLCLREAGTSFRAAASCPQRAEFDAFGIHPYSLAATPTKHAYTYGNVLVGDMGEVQALIAAADRLHTAAPRIHHQIWVTEWAWFTDPPNDVYGDPPAAAARYVAYSLYEMWRSGVDLVIWQNVQDTSTVADPGGGLYTAAGVPKLMLFAYAFPFVASVSHGSGLAWGRAPRTGRRLVWVQRLSGRRWHTVATTFTARDGVFEVGFPARGNAFYRAQLRGGPASLIYDSHPIPPRRTHLLNTG
jgi:hypothetical protein